MAQFAPSRDGATLVVASLGAAAVAGSTLRLLPYVTPTIIPGGPALVARGLVLLAVALAQSSPGQEREGQRSDRKSRA